MPSLTRSQARRRPQTFRWALLCLTALAFLCIAWGIRKNLPYTPEVDEDIFVAPAVHIAASGTLDPGWFGHPGSTVIYPLAGTFHVWHAATHRGTFFHPDPNLQASFEANPAEYYLLARLLTLAFAVLSVPLAYHVGRFVFGERAALLGALLSTLSPLTVTHAQMVRTDSAATFFGLLSLWLCLRLLQRQTAGRQVLAGAAIGLAIGSRYFMAALIPVLLAVDTLAWREQSRSSPAGRRAWWLAAGTGALAVGAAFALSTPFFFLNLGTALRDLQVEARTTHLGADGLTPLGNLWWYLSLALPSDVGWAQAALAVVGVGLVLRDRQPRQLLLPGFVVVFLGGIILSPLHWARWLIEILPLVSLLAAHALDAIILPWLGKLSDRPAAQGGLAAAALLVTLAGPAYQVVLLDVGQTEPSTRVQAREWLLRNLPAGSHIAQEWYTAPLSDTRFVIANYLTLASGQTLDDYRRNGDRYLVASSFIYDRYLAESQRYRQETAFYRDLFARGRLLQQFEPSITRSGPTIRVYELPAP